MGKQRFITGEVFKLDQTRYRIGDCLINNSLVLHDLSSGERIVKSLDELLDLWQAGRLLFEYDTGHNYYGPDKEKAAQYTEKDFLTLPEKQREEVQRRYEIILPLLQVNNMERPPRRVIKDYVDKLRLKNGGFVEKDPKEPIRKGIAYGKSLSITSVETWIKAFIDSDYSLDALFDSRGTIGEKGKSRLDPEINEIIANYLDYYKKHPRYRTVEDIHLDVVFDIYSMNQTRPEDDQLDIPDIETIYRRIREKKGV